MLEVQNKHIDMRGIADRFIAGESLADTYSISATRMSDSGLDLSTLSWVMQGTNADYGVLVQKAVTVVADVDNTAHVVFTWPVHADFVACPGALELALMGSDAAGNVVIKYNSSGVNVNKALSGDVKIPQNAIEDALAQIAAALPKIDGAVSSAQSAAASAAAATESASASELSRAKSVAAKVAAEAAKESAAGSATTAEEWAKTSASVSGFKGWYPNISVLRAVFPDATGKDGWFAILGSTDSVWTWDSDTTKWVDSKQGTIDLSNYYNKLQADLRFATAAQGALAVAAMPQSVYDPTHKNTDAFAYADAGDALTRTDTVHVYTHGYNAATHVHNFVGAGANGRALITAPYTQGDTFALNGAAVPAYTGAAATTELPVGRWATFVFDGAQVSFGGGGASGVKMELLWENASPTSAFPEQNISVRVLDYDVLVIIPLYASSATPLVISPVVVKCKVGSAFYFFGLEAAMFRAGDITGNSIHFYNTAGGANTSYLPYQIYGVKL